MTYSTVQFDYNLNLRLKAGVSDIEEGFVHSLAGVGQGTQVHF